MFKKPKDMSLETLKLSGREKSFVSSFFIFFLLGKKTPIVAEGVLDLSGCNFKKDGPIKIKGPWKKSTNKSTHYTLKIKGVK